MTYPNILRLVRLAASSACLLISALLIVLWVRSYYWADLVRGPVSRTTLAFSNDEDWLTLRWFKPRVPDARWKMTHESIELRNIEIQNFEAAGGTHIPLGTHFGISSSRLQLPHWFSILIFATLAAVPWTKWRFSLRTLLFATTLVALLLGLAVAMR